VLYQLSYGSNRFGGAKLHFFLIHKIFFAEKIIIIM